VRLARGDINHIGPSTGSDSVNAVINARLAVALTSASLTALLASPAIVKVAQARPTCTPSHSKTVVSNGFARVYGLKGKAYVCQKSNGKTRLLTGAKPSCNRKDFGAICDDFALGGKWVAWTRKNPNDVDVIGPRLTVMNVSSGSIDHKLYPTARREGEIYKVVLLGDGAVAWAESISDGGAGAFAVAVFGTDIKNHPVDRLDSCGGGVSEQVSCYITPRSLRVGSGKSVEWNYSPDGEPPANLTASHALY
jgi:hypothetical protein